MWSAFSGDEARAEMREAFLQGIGWGDAKKQLFELIDQSLSEPRERYEQLMTNPQQLEDILQAGAKRVRSQATELLAEIRDAVGLRPYSR